MFHSSNNIFITVYKLRNSLLGDVKYIIIIKRYLPLICQLIIYRYNFVRFIVDRDERLI